MVRFDEVRKRFADGTVAVDGVSFAVPRGQFCVVLGPSGSGKSTLLGTINGLTQPTGGRVLVDGTEVTARTLRGIQRRVGMVHQQFHLVGRLSVLDNVVSGALSVVPTWRALARIWPRPLERTACRLLRDVGLREEHLYRRAARLSGGEQQRVAIARAFILDPAVVLADEPVASLDPTISHNVLALLKSASRRTGAAVLCSLHQVELAVEFADRIVAMRAGRIHFDGPPDQLTDTVRTEVYGKTGSIPVVPREATP